MSEEKIINLLIEGGKASGGPPLAPALGPLGINVNEVVKEINEKTKDFMGIKLPVKVIVNTKTKEYTIEIGSPSTSSLIKKELGLEKVKRERKEWVADISFDKIVEIAKKKKPFSNAKTLEGVIKEVLGTCVSMGVSVEGKDPREITKNLEKYLKNN